MAVELKQFGDGSFGLQGDATGGTGDFIPVSVGYTASSPATASFFTASRNYVVGDISGRVDVAGTGGACTITVYVAPSGTAIGSGTALHTGTFNVAGTAATKQTLALGSTVSIPAGSSIGIVVTGTATSAVGSITVALRPAN